MAPKTLGPSIRGRHSHSTLPLGATSAVTSQSDRKAYSAIGGKADPVPNAPAAACVSRAISPCPSLSPPRGADSLSLPPRRPPPADCRTPVPPRLPYSAHGL